MKKLLIMLSAVALATGAFADEEQTATLTSGTETFEGFVLDEGPVNISTNTISDGKKLWYSAGNADEGETGAVTAYADGDTKPANGAASNANYLNVSTTTGTPLYRKLVAHDNQEGLDADSDSVDIGTGIFVDTYVQFSGSESAPELPPDSKLVVWVQAIDFDDKNTAEDTSDDIQGSTNLIVTAAMLSDAGVPTATNFVIETAADFDFEDWHRLTIRSIKEITSAGSMIAGFTVFVDGVQLAAKATQIAGAEAVTYHDLMGAYAYADNLTDEAKAFYNNRQLFVSLVRNLNPNAQKLSAVGFDGSGKVDDVTVSDDRSAFVFARGDFYFTLTWDNGIADFTVTADAKDAEGNEAPVTWDMADLTSGTPFAIPNTATKITISGITTKDGSSLVGDASRELDLLEYSSLSLTTETDLATVDGTAYTSFAAALAAAKSSGKELTLLADVTIAEAVELTGTDKLYLDLAGKTITFNGATADDTVGCPVFINVKSADAELKIISSGTEGAFAAGEAAAAVSDGMVAFVKADMGIVQIGNDTTDAGVVYRGMVYTYGGNATCTVYKGKFDATQNGSSTTLYFASQLATGATATDIIINDVAFVEVTPQAVEPEPTTFEVTVTEAANATYVFTGAEDLTAVVSGTELTFTATAADGYTYTDVELGVWTIDANDATKATYTVNVNEAMTVAIPAPAAIPAETLFDVEVAGNEKATYTSDPAKLTGLTAGTTVTITAEAKTGYTYDGFTAADGWSFDGQTATFEATIADANIAVTIPEPALVKAAFGDTEYATEADAQAAAKNFQAPDGVDGSIFSVEVVGTKVTVTLNEAVVKTSADTVAKAVGEALAKVLDGTAATQGITLNDVKNGLEYAVASAAELKDLDSVEPADGAYVKAQGGSVTLKVSKPSDSKGFFKIKVKYSGK